MTTVRLVVPVEKLLQILMEYLSTNPSAEVMTKLQLPEFVKITEKYELDDDWENATLEIEV